MWPKMTWRKLEAATVWEKGSAENGQAPNWLVLLVAEIMESFVLAFP